MEFINVANGSLQSRDVAINSIDKYSYCYDNDRTDNNVSYSSQNSTSEQQNNENNGDIHEINVNIYRYKFANDFADELYKFSKIHEYDDRKKFKEAWNNWKEDNIELVNCEVRRLTNLGYKKDILDKMFKSARYYFRKKNNVKKAPVKRRNYVSSYKELLKTMDRHIKTNIHKTDFKPSAAFENFCNENVEILKEEINTLINFGMSDSNEIKDKIKKTYKNRYFLIIK